MRLRIVLPLTNCLIYQNYNIHDGSKCGSQKICQFLSVTVFEFNGSFWLTRKIPWKFDGNPKGSPPNFASNINSI